MLKNYPLDCIALGKQEANTNNFEIESLKAASAGLFIVKLKGIDDKDAAEKLRDQEVWLATKHLPKTEAGEYYHFQLKGLQVLNADGRLIGKVIDVEQGTSNDNVVIEVNKKKHLIPMIADAIADVDIEAGKLKLSNLEGLLDNGF